MTTFYQVKWDKKALFLWNIVSSCEQPKPVLCGGKHLHWKTIGNLWEKHNKTMHDKAMRMFSLHWYKMSFMAAQIIHDLMACSAACSD